MEPRSLDTPEHAAYRAAILAYGGTEADLRAENEALRARIEELQQTIATYEGWQEEDGAA